MNKITIFLPTSDAKRWLIKNKILPTEELIQSLAKELKEFFDAGANS